MKKITFTFLLLIICHVFGNSWGFFAHQRINRLAVFSLPTEMFTFYKYYITYITENAVNPDKRRYAVEGEAPRHYIDIDIYDDFYKDSAIYKMPRYWKQAIEMHTEDTLQSYGIVPWHINVMRYRLTKAFERKDVKAILRISSDLGHYIADANVPLHTTVNYNGQLTKQKGIHGFWESRLPELYLDTYNLFVGQAEYLENPQLIAWEAVTNAHVAKDSVLDFERELTIKFPEDKKYTIEERNGINVRTYSRPFSRAYHNMLNGQVERRMRASIKMIANFWYTCWVNAGQPDLTKLLDKTILEELEKESEEEKKLRQTVKSREHGNVAFNNKCSPFDNCCCAKPNPYLAYYRKRVNLRKITKSD